MIQIRYIHLLFPKHVVMSQSTVKSFITAEEYSTQNQSNELTSHLFPKSVLIHRAPNSASYSILNLFSLSMLPHILLMDLIPL